MSKFSKILVIILLAAFLLPHFFTLAMTPQEEREALEEELKELEEKILQYEEDITKTEQEKRTLQNQIYILRQKVDKLNLQIQQSNVMIKDLGLQIEDTEGSIDQTTLKIEDSQIKLANILQIIYQEDQRSIIEILFSEKEFSDFFDDLMALETLNSKSKEFLQDIKNLKVSLEGQKESLDTEKNDLENVVKLTILQRQENELVQREKDYFLRLTEKEYQEYLKKKTEVELEAAEIRARIFELIGIPEAPTFGEALEIAKYVEGVTGVRPAFLLAVLTQESNIGKNVGQCYLKNPESGSGEVVYNGKEISRVMKPSRDVTPFLEITKELGRDPYSTPVSCPMSYGYGGAMGPAQFIPSTWMIYKDRVKAITGKAADPWNIKDAFLAAAVYLADYGATKQTYNGEFNAALSYFAGPSWYKSYYKNVYTRDYGYPVMRITARYETDIKALE